MEIPGTKHELGVQELVSRMGLSVTTKHLKKLLKFVSNVTEKNSQVPRGSCYRPHSCLYHKQK